MPCHQFLQIRTARGSPLLLGEEISASTVSGKQPELAQHDLCHNNRRNGTCTAHAHEPVLNIRPCCKRQKLGCTVHTAFTVPSKHKLCLHKVLPLCRESFCEGESHAKFNLRDNSSPICMRMNSIVGSGSYGYSMTAGADPYCSAAQVCQLVSVRLLSTPISRPCCSFPACPGNLCLLCALSPKQGCPDQYTLKPIQLHNKGMIARCGQLFMVVLQSTDAGGSGGGSDLGRPKYLRVSIPNLVNERAAAVLTYTHAFLPFKHVRLMICNTANEKPSSCRGHDF